MTLGLLKYHLLVLWREPISLAFGLGFPFLMLIMTPDITGDMLPWLIMVTAMVLCFTDAASSHAYARQIKFLRQLRLTPVSAKHYIGMGMLSRFIVLLVFTPVLIVITAIMADAGIEIININWLLFLSMLTLVYMMFYLIGMFISNLLKNPKSSQSLVYGVFFGLMAIGGLFFPIENMPEFLQHVARTLPPSYGIGILQVAWMGADIFYGHYFLAVVGVTIVFGLLSIVFLKYE